MLIVSWNVAGLKPALQRIHSDYGTTPSGGNGGGGGEAKSKKLSAPPPHPLAAYLRLHGNVDILCLQEHKIPYTELSSRSEPRRCSTIDGYESFWSCATDRKCRGFNGAVTYARVGTVRGADASPLGHPELDGQGRCVMTDHGDFVAFNAYVPHSSSRNARETLPRKMRFLNALRDAMRRKREKGGRRVMLVGDLNLKIDRRDVYWRNRVINVDEILDQVRAEENKDGSCGKESVLPRWKNDIVKNWDEIVRVLETIEALPRKTTNPSTKQKFDKFIARVKVAENKYVTLGRYEDTAEIAMDCYDCDEQYYIDPSNGTSTLYRKKNCLDIGTLAELMSKICDVTWNYKAQRQIAESSESGLNPDCPAYLWMKTLLEEDRMVDVFRHFYPTAEARFTCWNQLKNMRYSNVGGRIDFTLVDEALMAHVEPTNGGNLLRCGKETHDDPLGEEAALLAATAGGLFAAGTFAGGGIAEATKRALDTQFGVAHTGMIYTPPSYSDHVAVSLLMKGGFREHVVGELALVGGASTRKAQPHKSQRSVASFFSAGGSKSSSMNSSVSSARSSSALGAKRATPQEDGNTPKKKPLHSYFRESQKSTKKDGPPLQLNSRKSLLNKTQSTPSHK